MTGKSSRSLIPFLLKGIDVKDITSTGLKASTKSFKVSISRYVRQFNGGVELTCGLSALVVKAIEDPAVIEASICARGWEECA